MPTSDYKPRAVRKKTREVVEYNNDDSRPGKPLHLLIPGGLIGLASLGLIVAVIYQTWFQHEWDEGSGVAALVGLIPVYIGGVFLFSYGYELYDMERAIRLTAIIVFTTLACVLMVAVLGALLGAAGKSDGKSRSKDGNSKSDSSSSRSSSGGSWLASSGSSGSSSPTYVDVNLCSGLADSGSTVATPEPVEPPQPQPVACAYCDAAFIPEETEFTCPKCAAPYKVSEA